MGSLQGSPDLEFQEKQNFLIWLDLLPNEPTSEDDCDWTHREAGSFNRSSVTSPRVKAVRIPSSDELVIPGTSEEDSDFDVCDRRPAAPSPCSSELHQRPGPKQRSEPRLPTTKRPLLSPETSPAKRLSLLSPSPAAGDVDLLLHPAAASSSSRSTSPRSTPPARPPASAGLVVSPSSSSGGRPRFRLAKCPCCQQPYGWCRYSPPQLFSPGTASASAARVRSRSSGISDLSSLTPPTDVSYPVEVLSSPTASDGDVSSLADDLLSLSGVSSSVSAPRSRPATPRSADGPGHRPSVPDLDLVAHSLFTDHDYPMLDVGDIVEILSSASNLSGEDVIMTPDSLEVSRSQGHAAVYSPTGPRTPTSDQPTLRTQQPSAPSALFGGQQDDEDAHDVALDVVFSQGLSATGLTAFVPRETSGEDSVHDAHAVADEPAKQVTVDDILISRQQDAPDHANARELAIDDILISSQQDALEHAKARELAVDDILTSSQQDDAPDHAKACELAVDNILISSQLDAPEHDNSASELIVDAHTLTDQQTAKLAVVSDQRDAQDGLAGDLHAKAEKTPELTVDGVGHKTYCEDVDVRIARQASPSIFDAGQSRTRLPSSQDDAAYSTVAQEHFSAHAQPTLTEPSLAQHTVSHSVATAVQDLSRTLSNVSLQGQDEDVKSVSPWHLSVPSSMSNLSLQGQDKAGKSSSPQPLSVPSSSPCSLSSTRLDGDLEKQSFLPTLVSSQLNFQRNIQASLCEGRQTKGLIEEAETYTQESKKMDNTLLHLNTSIDLFANDNCEGSPSSLLQYPTLGLCDSFEHMLTEKDQGTFSKNIEEVPSSHLNSSFQEYTDSQAETSCFVQNKLPNSSQQSSYLNDGEWIVDMERENMRRFHNFESNVIEELPNVILEDDDQPSKHSGNCLGSQNTSTNQMEENRSDEHQLSFNSSMSSSPSRDLDALSLTQCHPQKHCAALKRKKDPSMKKTRKNWEQWYKQFKSIVSTGKQKLMAQSSCSKERIRESREENKENFYQISSFESDKVDHSEESVTKQEDQATGTSLISNSSSAKDNTDRISKVEEYNQSKWSQSFSRTRDDQISDEAAGSQDSVYRINTSFQKSLFKWNPNELPGSNSAFQDDVENTWRNEEPCTPQKIQRSVVRVGLSKRAKPRPLHVRKQWWVSNLWNNRCSIL